MKQLGSRESQQPSKRRGWTWAVVVSRGMGVAVAAFLCGSVMSCDSLSSRQRPPGSALWVGTASPALESWSGELEASSIREVFLEMGEIAFAAGVPRIDGVSAPVLPRRTPTTLVVSGEWTVGELDEQDAAESLAAGVRQLKIEAESRGLLPVGIHFDVDAGSALESYAQVLRLLRGELDEQLLSASVEGSWLSRPEMEELARAVHYLVPFLYGQRLEAEKEESRLWDLAALEESLTRLEELEVDYVVGVVTLGGLSHLGRGDDLLATTGRAHLSPLLHNSSLKIEASFAFEGFHRQVFNLEARRPVEVGDWAVRSGEKLRVVRPLSSHVQELVGRLGQLDLEHHRGEVFYRLSQPEESLSLSLDHLLRALGPGDISPEINVDVARLRATSSAWTLKVELNNPSSESTALALQDLNYVELRADGGVWGQVELGDFRRMDLVNSAVSEGAAGQSRRRSGRSMRSIRDADILRLHYPIVDAGLTLSSGPVYLLLKSRRPQVTISGQFRLPGGRSLALPPTTLDPDKRQ